MSFFPYQSLPGCMDHCYVLTSRCENKSAVMGALVSKIPFTHPSHVPSILDILRCQAAYSTLLNSCLSPTINPKGKYGPLLVTTLIQKKTPYTCQERNIRAANTELLLKMLVANLYLASALPSLKPKISIQQMSIQEKSESDCKALQFFFIKIKSSVKQFFAQSGPDTRWYLKVKTW